MVMKLPQLSAVVAGANGDHFVCRGRFNGRNHGVTDRSLIDAIDDDLVRALDTFMKFGFNASP